MILGIFLWLWTNLWDKEKNLLTSIEELENKWIKILKVSKLYETEPMYILNQDKFIN